jgi:DNA-binding MarR family transcriptional regulator
LTDKGEALFRKTFSAHAAFLRPRFERALTKKEAEQLQALLLRIRDSFQRPDKQPA